MFRHTDHSIFCSDILIEHITFAKTRFGHWVNESNDNEYILIETISRTVLKCRSLKEITQKKKTIKFFAVDTPQTYTANFEA